ncbi:MAG: hypothetical protein WD186_00325 [Actinomycetota bacterium]
MTRTDPTRRRFPAAPFFVPTLLALTLALALALVPVLSLANPAGARETKVAEHVCQIDWRDGEWQVRQLIRCAADRWHVPGGMSMALYVADRESEFRPQAYNGYSGASGIFQHLSRYWPGRADTFGFGGWSAFNARANIMVTMRMVHRSMRHISE